MSKAIFLINRRTKIIGVGAENGIVLDAQVVEFVAAR